MGTAISIIIAFIALFIVCILSLLKASTKDNRCYICGKSIKEGQVACDGCEGKNGTED
jgi:hypothetical protein